jgi:hypothetical protein
MKNDLTNTIEFGIITNRNQAINESIESYGKYIIHNAKLIFPNAKMDTIDEYLKFQFANGLKNAELS